MRIRRTIIAALALLAAAACSKDNVILYGDTEIGNVVDGRFHSDAGLVYTVTEQTCDGKLEDDTRVLIICDILKRTGDKSYDIRLRSFILPLCKQPVAEGVLSEEDSREDPVSVASAWFGGGYLNINMGVYVLPESETKHVFNLVHYTKAGSDTLYLDLKHNANGEYFGAPDIKDSDLQSGGLWACFPMEGVVPDGVKSVPVKLSWMWHRLEDGNMVEDTERHSLKGVFER
jgi:hypothetical protein